jgi:hypothetical protein
VPLAHFLIYLRKIHVKYKKFQGCFKTDLLVSRSRGSVDKESVELHSLSQNSARGVGRANELGMLWEEAATAPIARNCTKHGVA